MTSKCENCRFWNPGRESWQTYTPEKAECHRNPPMLVDVKYDSKTHSWWPKTDRGEWCGEHRPKPTLRPRLAAWFASIRRRLRR